MAFQATWRGVCSECDEYFPADEFIERSEAGYRHAGVCPVDQTWRVGEICTKCFIEKSVTGKCGCEE